MSSSGSAAKTCAMNSSLISNSCTVMAGSKVNRVAERSVVSCLSTSSLSRCFGNKVSIGELTSMATCSALVRYSMKRLEKVSTSLWPVPAADDVVLTVVTWTPAPGPHLSRTEAVSCVADNRGREWRLAGRRVKQGCAGAEEKKDGSCLGVSASLMAAANCSNSVRVAVAAA